MEIIETIAAKIGSLFKIRNEDHAWKANLVRRAIGIRTDDIVRIEMQSPAKIVIVYRYLHFMGAKEFVGNQAEISKFIECVLDSNPEARLSHAANVG